MLQSFAPLRWFRDAWSAIDLEAADERSRDATTRGFDRRAAWALVTAAVVLVGQGKFAPLPRMLTDASGPFAHSRYLTLLMFDWWCLTRLLWFFVVPCVCARVAGLRLRDCGLAGAGFARHLWIYIALLAAVAPLVVFASHTQGFRAMYPFYKSASRSWLDLLAAEMPYGLSFLGIEFFFRGYLLFALRRSLGTNAIFAMLLPYAMIHLGKPPAEAFGSIFTGIVLGTLSLRTRSIWGGVAIHVAVAWSMDMLALAHTSGFPHALVAAPR